MIKLITICNAFILAFLIEGVFAADRGIQPPPGSAPAGRSIGEFLTSEGKFDLDAVRRSGYQGTLDFQGADLRVDPRSGAPFVLASRSHAPASIPDDIYWANGFAASGMVGQVITMAVYQGKLIVGGGISGAGNLAVQNIASWNGTEWSALGLGTNDAVFTMTIYNNKLIVGGTFTSAGGTSANRIASWDGTSWSAMGSGVNDTVRAMTVFRDTLVVGGAFTSAGGLNGSRLAFWTPTGWNCPWYLTVNGTVRALQPWIVNHISSSDTCLVIGGTFTSVGVPTVNASNLAVWNANFQTWAAFSPQLAASEKVRALVLFNNTLVVGGADALSAYGGFTCHYSRPQTSVLPSPPTWSYGPIQGFGLWGGCVIACGYFSSIQKFDGASWTAVGARVDADAWTAISYNGKLVVGGTFGQAGTAPASRIASWDGISWSPLSVGTNGSFDAFTSYNGALIGAGYFSSVGGTSANGVASWNGLSWSPLGGGMFNSSLGYSETPLCAAVYNSQLVVGGFFSRAGGSPVQNIAAWDGSNWSSLGAGIDLTVTALLTHDGKLYAAGGFSHAGGVVANNIAAWNGSTWSAVGAGTNGIVRSLGEFEGKLVAGGEFTTAGGVSAKGVASWNGATWASLGAGLRPGYVTSLVTYGTGLVAGGTFDSAGSVAASNIATWNGSSWSALGLGIRRGEVYALAAHQNQLFVGGTFDSAGSVGATRIAAWDGSIWSECGSGIRGTVYSLCSYNNQLIVGGNFATAGDKFSAYYATWTKSYLADSDTDGVADINDNCPYMGNPDQSDWNHDGSGDICTPTGTGHHVVVQPTANTTVTFDSVSVAGTTGVVVSGTGPSSPPNFVVIPLGNPHYYAISTTTTHTGQVKICVTYASGDVFGDESRLSILHDSAGLWTDITSLRDTIGNVICGITTSFSTFALMQSSGCCTGTTGNVNMSGIVDLGDLSALVSYLTGGGYVIPCPASANVNASGILDLGDLSSLVSYLTGGGYVLPNCP